MSANRAPARMIDYRFQPIAEAAIWKTPFFERLSVRAINLTVHKHTTLLACEIGTARKFFDGQHCSL
jgi:hypothetical protein